MCDDCVNWPVFVVVTFLCILFIGCFWCTKEPGWGPYTTSTLLIVAVVSIAAVLFAGNLLGSDFLENILWAAIGFGGGVLAAKSAGKS